MQAPAYPVDARAHEDSVLVQVSSRDFLAALRDSPDTCFRLLAIMSQRLHSQVQEIEELALESAGARLVLHLLRRAEPEADGRARVRLDEKKQELAAKLAIKPETLSRLLKSLGEAGLIEVDGRDIVIPDLARLQQHEL
jgi:CRP-like cAMP-binding protein